MFCCLRLLNGVSTGQFIVCKLFTFLPLQFLYIQNFVQNLHILGMNFLLWLISMARLIINSLLVNRECFTIAVASCHFSLQISVELTM